ncbi:MAG: spermine synthase, partial [Candidatus Omnitrophica bacterium]|nr:spermine synthase [Candidatus Omnitrophota bacterium]
LEVLFSLMLPFSIYLSRAYKSLLGLPSGEALGLVLIFWASLLIIFPVSFCHGALFSAGCKICSLFGRKEAVSIGSVYAWEILGTIVGGVVFTYLFIPFISSFQIVFIISILNLFVSFLILNYLAAAKSKYLVLSLALLAICFTLFGGVDYLERSSIKRKWQGIEVLDDRNSVYGNIAVTRQKEQYTFYHNGIPLITSPYPDTRFKEEFGHFPLLFHHLPEEILVVSAGAGGLINEILKHPVERVDYVEIDPLLVKMLEEYPTELTRSELNDPRVHIINTDGRFFLKNNQLKYDIVLIGLSSPSDLSTNRFFTKEFFSLVKSHLKPQGIAAFWLPGSLTYLSSELKGLNKCILDTLNQAYEHVRIIPGDYNIYLASASKEIMNVTPEEIWKKINAKKIQSSIFTFSYLSYRLKEHWVDWFKQSLAETPIKINRDLQPLAVFKMLIFWNKKFSPGLSSVLERFESLRLIEILILVFTLTGLTFFLFLRKRNQKIILTSAITTSGFFAMLANLVLIFSYQVFYGYLYHRIGLLISFFMAGTAAGSILITSKMEKIKRSMDLFIILEALIIIFSFLMAFMLSRFQWSGNFAAVLFISLFFISGLFLGLEFPLAGKLYLGKNRGVGGVSGALYASDLIGGWVAGIFGGIILLPVLGLFGSCMVIVIVKAASLILLLGNRFLLKNL